MSNELAKNSSPATRDCCGKDMDIVPALDADDPKTDVMGRPTLNPNHGYNLLWIQGGPQRLLKPINHPRPCKSHTVKGPGEYHSKV